MKMIDKENRLNGNEEISMPYLTNYSLKDEKKENFYAQVN